MTSAGTPVRILHATCPCSFGVDENDIIIVGLTDEGAARALGHRLMRQFDAKKPSDREFWDDDFDRYYESWNINTTGGRLEP